MLKKLCLFVTGLLVSFSVISGENWKEYIQKKLPPPLQSIIVKKSTQAEVEKLLGKPSLVEKNKHYYEMNQFKYDLELVYNKKILSEMSYTFTVFRPEMAPLKLDVKQMSSYPGTGKAPGRFLKYADKNGEIIIDPITKSIYSVRIK